MSSFDSSNSKANIISRFKMMVDLGSIIHPILPDIKPSRNGKRHAAWIMCQEGNSMNLRAEDPALRAFQVRCIANRSAFLEREPGAEKIFLGLSKDPSPDVLLQVTIASRKIKGIAALPVLLD